MTYYIILFRWNKAHRKLPAGLHDTNLFKSNYNYSFEPQILNRENKKNQKHAPEELVGQKTNAKNQEDKIPTTFIEAKQEDYFYLFKDISSFDFDLVQGLRSTSH